MKGKWIVLWSELQGQKCFHYAGVIIKLNEETKKLSENSEYNQNPKRYEVSDYNSPDVGQIISPQGLGFSHYLGNTRGSVISGEG